MDQPFPRLEEGIAPLQGQCTLDFRTDQTAALRMDIPIYNWVVGQSAVVQSAKQSVVKRMNLESRIGIVKLSGVPHLIWEKWVPLETITSTWKP